MVGSAFMRRFEAEGFTNLLKPQRFQLDLMKEDAVLQFFLKESPDIVILAAAKVGGIKANNDYPVDFLLENLRIQNNVIRSADQSGVRKLLFLGSSCIYPKPAPQIFARGRSCRRLSLIAREIRFARNHQHRLR